jgi:hypothetical protein
MNSVAKCMLVPLLQNFKGHNVRFGSNKLVRLTLANSFTLGQSLRVNEEPTQGALTEGEG